MNSVGVRSSTRMRKPLHGSPDGLLMLFFHRMMPNSAGPNLRTSSMDSLSEVGMLFHRWLSLLRNRITCGPIG